MAARTTRPKSALAALTADEKATAFDQLLQRAPSPEARFERVGQIDLGRPLDPGIVEL